MNTEKHTPTPWKLEMVGWHPSQPKGFCLTPETKTRAVLMAGCSDSSSRVYAIESESSKLFSPDELKQFYTIEEMKANAEFTHRAVNTHDELVKALKFVVKQLDCEPSKQAVLYSDALAPNSDEQTVLDYLKSALRKAGGE